TCTLAGFADQMTLDDDLMEWDYGAYEGLRTKEIQQQNPTWNLFRDGCPNGESPQQIATRADHVIARLRAFEGTTALFSSGHILRVLTARWLGFPPQEGEHFALNTASISILGY